VGAVRHRIDVLVLGYQWTGTMVDVIEAMLWWQDRCWRGIQAEAEAADPRMQALRSDGVIERVQADFRWTLRHLARV
jgi:hypothetical protein